MTTETMAHQHGAGRRDSTCMPRVELKSAEYRWANWARLEAVKAKPAGLSPDADQVWANYATRRNLRHRHESRPKIQSALSVVVPAASAPSSGGSTMPLDLSVYPDGSEASEEEERAGRPGEDCDTSDTATCEEPLSGGASPVPSAHKMSADALDQHTKAQQRQHESAQEGSNCQRTFSDFRLGTSLDAALSEASTEASRSRSGRMGGAPKKALFSLEEFSAASARTKRHGAAQGPGGELLKAKASPHALDEGRRVSAFGDLRG